MSTPEPEPVDDVQAADEAVEQHPTHDGPKPLSLDDDW
ncbi:hypothetical protein IW245_000079 [Longispora fulva]|uniref:Uncharacterized protein n=1 Tax=Longispora fulva TaxID=619741 RepID=A0A8J7G6Q1_9ACTN|nr:hypothetical protein [Longispora fulva]